MTVSKTYHVIIDKRANKQLKKLDPFVRSTILQWLDKNIEGTNNPWSHGKGLTANHSGEWRYRVGDYRILCYIKDNIVTVEVFSIGHRKEIYD
ncbi:MAG: type II toxin-antitoxin system RelE/ParE family toxin [Streptococcaceae bacterium]|jgi:mRNA interferase RelE/StbE|nr:type II toxin-antitoxin system RelE/ParE family toxin [Streptococcaceae bacterium]